MRLKRAFFLTFSFFLILWGITGYSENRSAEIQKVDGDLQQLQEMKRGYEAKALRHEEQAAYLQFDQQTALETRRHLQLAQENRNKAALVQEQIDRLQIRRGELQK